MVDRAHAAGIPASAAPNASSAVDGADVIVTVTQSTSPLFPADGGRRELADLRGRCDQVRPMRDRRRTSSLAARRWCATMS